MPESPTILIAALLTVLFVTLRLCNVIAWEWLWVISPVWITLGVYLVVGLINLLVGGVKKLTGG